MQVRWFYVSEMASNGVVKIIYIPTAEQIADALTKAQGPAQYAVTRTRIGIVEIINFTKKAHAVTSAYITWISLDPGDGHWSLYLHFRRRIRERYIIRAKYQYSS